MYCQDEIAVIEDEMNRLDKQDEKTKPYRLCSRRYDEEEKTDRKDLMALLNHKMKEYDDLILREHAIMSIKDASEKAHRTYFDYVWNEKPLCEEEYQFIFRKGDFMELGEQGDTWLGSWVEVLQAIVPRRLLKVSTSLFS